MGFFDKLRPKNGRSARTKIPKEANTPPKLDPTQIKSIPLGQEPSQGELLNRVELGDFKALTDYSDKRGGFSDEVLCAIAKREDLRALGGYDLFKKLLKDRFELCPPKNIDEESMSLGKHMFTISVARKYKTPLYTLINGEVLPSENEITDLIRLNE